MPSSRLSDMPCSDDHIYEACRLTSMLLIQSVESNRHWHVVATGTSTLRDIRDALQKTDLDRLWDKNIGILYFVALVFHSAAFGTPENPYGYVLQGRVHFEVTCSYNDWHGALLPMAVLSDLMPDTKSPTFKGASALELMTGYSTTLLDVHPVAGSCFPIPSYDIKSHG